MKVFELALLQLQREGLADSKDYADLLIDRAITIRNYLTKNKEE